jgi:hypothetical protein
MNTFIRNTHSKEQIFQYKHSRWYIYLPFSNERWARVKKSHTKQELVSQGKHTLVWWENMGWNPRSMEQHY